MLHLQSLRLCILAKRYQAVFLEKYPIQSAEDLQKYSGSVRLVK